jgi:hypothetical protein
VAPVVVAAVYTGAVSLLLATSVTLVILRRRTLSRRTRAQTLLEEHLTPGQRQQLAKYRNFDVDVSPRSAWVDSSRWPRRVHTMRICLLQHGVVVYAIDRNAVSVRYCMGPHRCAPEVPPEDVALAHLLMLRHAPKAWFAEAVPY